MISSTLSAMETVCTVPRRSQQEILGAGTDAKHEVEQIVGFLFSVARASAAAGLVGFIEDNRTEFSIQQMSLLFGVVENEPG